MPPVISSKTWAEWECVGTCTFTEELRLRGGFIPAEALVQNVNAGDNDTVGGALNPPVLGFVLG